MTLHKATLQEVDPKASPRPTLIGSPISVQVNPTSLRLALANNTEVGKAAGRPNTQSQGLYSSTLSFDLMFDTADQGSTAQPTDVRTLTAQLEYYLLPKKGDAKAVPPRLKFVYGSLEVVGVMSALNLEFDLFADSGIPLRAKASVTIKEQKPEFDADLLGPGANTGSAATNPLPGPSGGTSASPSPDRTGTALGGESASDFATRMGLDPSAWKDLAAGISDPLRLDAGLQIDFSASVSVGTGLGVTAGTSAGSSGGGPAGRPGPDRSRRRHRRRRAQPGALPADGHHLGGRRRGQPRRLSRPHGRPGRGRGHHLGPGHGGRPGGRRAGRGARALRSPSIPGPPPTGSASRCARWWRFPTAARWRWCTTGPGASCGPRRAASATRRVRRIRLVRVAVGVAAAVQVRPAPRRAAGVGEQR